MMGKYIDPDSWLTPEEAEYKNEPPNTDDVQRVIDRVLDPNNLGDEFPNWGN